MAGFSFYIRGRNVYFYRKDVTYMEQKVVNLDHLTDQEYDERFNQLEKALTKALNIVLDSWVKDRVITDQDRQTLIKSLEGRG